MVDIGQTLTATNDALLAHNSHDEAVSELHIGAARLASLQMVVILEVLVR